MDVLLRAGGKLCGVGVGAHLGQLNPGPARDHEGAGLQGIAGPLDDGIGLACDEGLIHLNFPGAHQGVGTDLVSGGQLHDVVPDQQAGSDLHPAALSYDLGRMFCHQRQLIHGPLGADLLDGANGSVGNGNHQEHHVFVGSGNHQQDSQNEKNQVKKGEGIFANDLPLGFGGGLAGVIGPATGTPRLDLSLGEAQVGVCFQNRERAAGCGFCCLFAAARG